MADESEEEPATPPSAWQLLRAKQKQQPNLAVPNFSANGELVSQFQPPKFKEGIHNRPPLVPPTVNGGGGGVNDSIADLKSWMHQIQKDAENVAEDKYREHNKVHTLSLLTSLPASIQNRSLSPLASPSRRRKPSAKDQNDAKMLLKAWHRVDEDTSRVRTNKSSASSYSTKPSHEIALNFDRQNSGNSFDNNFDNVHHQSSAQYASSPSMYVRNSKNHNGDSFEGLFDETEEERERIQRLLPTTSASSASPLHNESKQDSYNDYHSLNKSHGEYSVGQVRKERSNASTTKKETSHIGKSQVGVKKEANRITTQNRWTNDVVEHDYEKQAMMIREKEQAAMFDISCDIFIRRMKRKRLGRCFVGWVNYFKCAVYNFTVKSNKAYQFHERNLTFKVFFAWRQHYYKLVDFKFRVLRKKLRRKFRKCWIKWQSETHLYSLKVSQFQKQMHWRFICRIFISWHDYSMFLVDERKKAHAKIKEAELIKKERAADKWFTLRVYSKIFLVWCQHIEDIKKEKRALLKHEEEKNRIAKFVQRIAVIDGGNDSPPRSERKEKEEDRNKSVQPIAQTKERSHDVQDKSEAVSDSRFDYKLGSNGKKSFHHNHSINSDVDVQNDQLLDRTSLRAESKEEISNQTQNETQELEKILIGTESSVEVSQDKGDILSSMEKRAEERRKAREKLRAAREKTAQAASSPRTSSSLPLHAKEFSTTPSRSSGARIDGVLRNNVRKSSPIEEKSRSPRSSSASSGGGRASTVKPATSRLNRAHTSQSNRQQHTTLNSSSVQASLNRSEEALRVALELAHLHYSRSLLIYFGLRPWKKLMFVLKLDTLKADNFHHDQLLSRYWKVWQHCLTLRRFEQLRSKGEAVIWTCNYLDRKRFSRYFQHWLNTIRDLYAMATAVENLHKFTLMKSTMSRWNRNYASEKSKFYVKYDAVKELSKRLRKRGAIRLWYDVLLKKKMENEVSRRREQRWKQVRGWLNTEEMN